MLISLINNIKTHNMEKVTVIHSDYKEQYNFLLHNYKSSIRNIPKFGQSPGQSTCLWFRPNEYMTHSTLAYAMDTDHGVIIDFNNHILKENLVPEWTRYLMRIAKQKYNIGDTFRIVHQKHLVSTILNFEIGCDTLVSGQHFNLFVRKEPNSECSSSTVFYKGEWAEVITQKTEECSSNLSIAEKQPQLHNRYHTVMKEAKAIPKKVHYISNNKSRKLTNKY